MVNDYSKLFNENMSSFEARNVFWNAAENLSKTERESSYGLKDKRLYRQPGKPDFARGL